MLAPCKDTCGRREKVEYSGVRYRGRGLWESHRRGCQGKDVERRRKLGMGRRSVLNGVLIPTCMIGNVE